LSSTQAIEDLVTLVRQAAARSPGRVVLTFPASGQELTFAEFDERSDRIARALLKLGIAHGDRVAVMLGNRPEFPLLWIAIAKSGAVMVPINMYARSADASYLLQHSGAAVMVTDSGCLDLAVSLRELCPVLQHVLSVDEPAAEAAAAGVIGLPGLSLAAEGPPLAPAPPERTVNIQYTSGTTGRPKGCVLSHYYWCRLARWLITGPPPLTADDVLLTAQPFYYMDPQWNLAVALLAGARLVVLDRFHPSTFWPDVREHGVTFFYCLGMMPRALYNMPADLDDRHHRVRGIACSAIPLALHQQLEDRWGAPWFEAFGMTETGGDLRTFLADRDGTVGTGCIGRPFPDRELRVVDGENRPLSRGSTGELVLRGPGMMDGYFRDEAATNHAFRGGWFHTGDLVRQDDAGRVYYIGRTKDMIRRSGENISATEVEAVLCEHPSVLEAACVAVPDELRGEEVKAYVVPKQPAAPPSPEELHAWVSERLAYFKVPRYWEYVSEMPKTPSERVAKAELTKGTGDLRACAWDAAERRWR
jgi:carnitine-CoA ligase